MRPGFFVRQALVVAAVLIGSCADDTNYNDTITTHVDPGVDFSQYHTFALSTAPAPPGTPTNVAVNLATAQEEARAQLLAYGLTEVDGATGNPDLVVFSLGASQQSGGYVWSCVPGYWWGYWGWVWDPCAWLEPIYVSYAVGSLVVGTVDPKLQKIVFGGVAQGTITNEGNPTERIQQDVARIFADYPH
ncbi:MAG: DUF4136 domain-containing protein [Polyangiales bacterium]